jgi:hypothetical protein
MVVSSMAKTLALFHARVRAAARSKRKCFGCDGPQASIRFAVALFGNKDVSQRES